MAARDERGADRGAESRREHRLSQLRPCRSISHAGVNRRTYSGRDVDASWREAVAALVDPLSADVVNVGRGGGTYTRAWHELGAATVTGVDFSGPILEAARESHGHLPGVAFRHGDAAATRLPDDCADVVFQRVLIHHTPDLAAVAAEAARLLRPGGILLVRDRIPCLLCQWHDTSSRPVPPAGRLGEGGGVDERTVLTVEAAEAFAQRILAMIDANEEAIRRAATAVVSDRHDADRARVASDLEGLQMAQRHPGRGLEKADLEWLRQTFSDGLLRTGAIYGVRP